MDSGLGIGGFSHNVQETTSSKLDLFSPIVLDHGIKERHDIEVRPQTISDGNGPVEFIIHPDEDKFTDPQSMAISGRVAIMKKVNDKWVLTDTQMQSDLALTKNFFQSLWSSVIIKVQNQDIGDLNNMSYPYSTYLQSMLGARSPMRNTLLSEDGYDAYVLRSGSYTDFEIELKNDVNNCIKYLPPGVKLSVILRRSPDSFMFAFKNDDMKVEDYKIDIQDLCLKITKYTPDDNVMSYFEKEKKKSPPYTLYTRNVLKTYTSTKGSYDLTAYNLFHGNALPNRIYVTLVDQAAFGGNPKLKSLQFQPHEISEISLIVNNVRIPSKPLTYQEGVDEASMYRAFLYNTGTSHHEMDSVMISKKEYFANKFVVAFDLSKTRDNGLYTHKPMRGSMSVCIKTRKALEKNVMILVYASYDSVLTFIDDKVVTDIMI